MHVISFETVLRSGTSHPMHPGHGNSPKRVSQIFRHVTSEDVQNCCAGSPFSPTVYPMGFEVEENAECHGAGSYGDESRSEDKSPSVL